MAVDSGIFHHFPFKIENKFVRHVFYPALNIVFVLSRVFVATESNKGLLQTLDKMFDEEPAGDFETSHAEYNWYKNLIKYFIILLKISSRH